MHNLNEQNGRTAMAYVGDPPWHRKGQRLLPNTPLEQWPAAAGMDFNIRSTPVLYCPANVDPINARTVRYGDGSDATRIGEYKGRRVLYRDDNGVPLSVVSARYKVVQPRAVLEFFRELVERQGFSMETAGVLGAGEAYWALARTGQSMQIGSDDRSNAYLLLATSADGSRATEARTVATRVVCQNTLDIAMSGRSTDAVKVRHTSTFRPEQVHAQLGLVDWEKTWNEYCEQARKLATVGWNATQAAAYMAVVLDDRAALKCANPDGVDPENTAQWNDVLRQITAAQILSAGGRSLSQAYAVLRRHGNDSKAARGTAWGVVNAITRYVDHERPTRHANGSPQAQRWQSATFGSGQRIKQRAWEVAQRMVA